MRASAIAPSNLGSSSAITDFLREARAGSGLNHPGIVAVYEVIRNADSVANRRGVVPLLE